MVAWLNSYKIYIICGIGILVLILILLLALKLKKRAKKYINNQDYIPPLPMSNIIIDKKRFTYNKFSTINPVPKNNRVYLDLVDIITGKKYKLKFKNQLSVGRGRHCEFSIKDALVSKNHCMIVFDGNQLFIKDNNSDNGTILNGIIINNQTPIYVGDLLLIGGKEFKVEAWGIA